MLRQLQIQNFKAWEDSGEIRLAPLTIFCGNNSSGKSSIAQFLLMLKQTVESYDRKRVLHLGDVVLDNQWHILNEYQNKMLGTQNSFSHQFLKYILNNQRNTNRVKQVPITSVGADDFDEFPETLRSIGFDPSDRKFVAVAVSNKGKSPIMQAADCEGKMEGLYLRLEDERFLKLRAKVVQANFIQSISNHWSREKLVENRLLNLKEHTR
jgi:predicted ATPase